MTTLQSLLEQSQRLESNQLSSTLSLPSATTAARSGAPSSSFPFDAHHPSSGALSNDRRLPTIQLGLDQIEAQSRRIAAKSIQHRQPHAHANPNPNPNPNAAFLLAHAGVNADQLQSTVEHVNLAGTFEPLLPLNDTDVQGFLTHTHEQTIIAAIEQGRRQTTADFYRSLDASIRHDWERQKENLFDELGRHQPGYASGSSSTAPATSSTPKRGLAPFAQHRASPLAPLPSSSTAGGNNPSGSLQMHSRMMRYDRVVRRLNEFRKQGFAFALVSAFGEASIGVGANTTTHRAGDPKATQTTETWRLLAHVVQERDVLNGEFQRKALQERQYAAAYLGLAQDAVQPAQLRKMIAEGAKHHLEEQFMNYVEKLLASRPTEAGLGGVPSLQNKIRAFLNVKYHKNGQWTNPNLEIANNTPVWARIYYLLRAGHPFEALAFATENEAQIQKLEKSFVAYLKAYLDSPDQRLPKLLRDRFLSEYNQRIRYLTDTSDPYKHALYKLIGRVEINRRNVPGVTQTTEDWLWFQLSLVREAEAGGVVGTEAPHERYGLRDLAKVLVKFGEAHFDPKGNRPMLYFQVLLLSGQFERAIAFLHQHSQFHVDAVHFAIALEYYGLLRIPSAPHTSDVDLLVVEQDSSGYDLASIHFARLLHRYTRSFAQTDTEEALNYLYLICLNADLPAPLGPNQIKSCHDHIRQLVMETRNYAQLLGDVKNDGTKVPGLIERDLKLIHLKDERSYLFEIVKSAATRADQEKRFSEAILLYNLADEWDSVIAVLNAELGQSLTKPSSHVEGANRGANEDYFSKSNATVGMAAGQEDIAQIAHSILQHYDRQAGGAGGRISRKNRETCHVLLRLKEAMTLNEQGHFEKALQTIQDVNLVPLHGDLVAIIRAAEEFKSLDETLVRNFDTILLTTMQLIYKIHQAFKSSPFGDAARQQSMVELRQKARSLMMFAGMVSFGIRAIGSSWYRLTSETYSQLTRLDVFIH
ncbi:BZ3500_MvSof-1268-A1-R1_Chr1-1g01098 [Microbotryum saponariae]|uniref:Nuclear pore protein n=1 Tax=Microbotryum saponariae TaxID=289078 RepID=A0A2X0LBY7_9BASI|nr:BZ3500_MvSof-1268-A1-R1_Chr1-1g01098 [Microbotryum saponariae]SCZ93383.1 BZ3501_MvSof-1269-A2-R1_Chr1-1g00695 [Microbotryum saponariae]